MFVFIPYVCERFVCTLCTMRVPGVLQGREDLELCSSGDSISPLQGQPMLLMAEPSLQPLVNFKSFNIGLERWLSG